MFVQLIPFVALFSSAVFGAPAGDLAELESRAGSKCVTHAEGYLTTAELTFNGEGGHWRKFSFNDKNQFAYIAITSRPPIRAQFQTCTPNYANGTNQVPPNSDPADTTFYGRIYLPDFKQCLAVDSSGSLPYSAKRTSCISSASGEMTTSKSIPFNFSFNTFHEDTSRKIISWIGKTKADGTRPQGGAACPSGAYGYLHTADNTPVLEPSSGEKVEIVCIKNDYKAVNIFAELRDTYDLD